MTETIPSTTDYTGLGAVAWALFSGEEPGPDFPFFEGILRRDPGPALDVGCGTGRLLLPLLAAGLEVEGAEPSADMRTICRERAAARGLSPVLYNQALQRLDLPRRYRTAIIPCGTFQLILDRGEAFEALRRLHAHLHPGGLLALTAYNRWQELETEQVGVWRHQATRALPDGTAIAKHARVEGRDFIEQTLAQTVRYRRLRGGAVIEEQLCDAPERWYFQHELILMLERAGFVVERVTGDYDGAPFADGHFVMTVQARRADSTPA